MGARWRNKEETGMGKRQERASVIGIYPGILRESPEGSPLRFATEKEDHRIQGRGIKHF